VVGEVVVTRGELEGLMAELVSPRTSTSSTSTRIEEEIFYRALKDHPKTKELTPRHTRNTTS
jgi:hypothetical protein